MTLDIDFELELACGYEQAEQEKAEQERALCNANNARSCGVGKTEAVGTVCSDDADVVNERPVTTGRPPYTVKCLVNKGNKLGRYKVEKTVPGEKTKVYYVTFGSELMTCTCPDSKYRRPGKCKHAQGIARLVGRQELVS